MKSSSVRTVGIAASLAWTLVAASSASAQTNYYGANGTEYPIVGYLIGDQVHPDLAVSTTNGIVVWQDNATDGNGLGISARRLDGTLSGALGTFRVNVNGVGDQENAHVALLKNGGAAFVWQGGLAAAQHIYARYLSVSNTFLSTSDILVNTVTNTFQATPALTVLTNGNVVVVWASYNQAGTNSLLDVYGQILSPTGANVGTNFLINQFTGYNQRTPTVAPLKNGGFVVAWVSEQQRAVAPNWGSNNTYYGFSPTLPLPTVDIYARLFNASGAPVGNEFLVNTDLNTSANPDIATASDGSFMVVWSAKDRMNATNGWDVHARTFSSTGTGRAAFIVNTRIYGDEYLPHVSSIGQDYMVTWTSMGQDGSREGVFAQFVHADGSLIGGEFQVNTTTIGQQIHPTVASDGVGQFVVVWTSFTGLPYSFDLFAQRYLNVASLLQPMSAPYVWAPFVLSNGVYQPRLVVSWPSLLGLSVTNYEVYVDGGSTPMGIVVSNQWTMTAANGLSTNSTHSFQLDYVTTDGRRSPLSPAASGTTWSGANYYGIPFEWIEAYYGLNFTSWPTDVNAPLAPGGPSLYQVFLGGGNPTDPSTWLKQQLTRTSQGIFLGWNTTPGGTYQVQVTTDFKNWTNLGSPRFAAGKTDSINVGGNAAGYYRVVLQR
ncbi:MAG TPA: hypothetical protein VF988_12365 [Verrucomicrobiae bacterium]